MSDDPFDVPARPERRYTATGGVEYEGSAVVALSPEAPDDLDGLLSAVLDDERYVRGDWFDLPRPMYLVHDRAVPTSFRAVVREGRIELHLLPGTDAAGLEALYERLVAASGDEWSVDWTVEEP